MRPSCFLHLLLAALSCLLLLTACSPAVPRDPFAYAAAPFSFSVEGTYLPANDGGGVPRPFAAKITVGAPQNGDPTRRDLAVTFTAPAALAGVTVTAALSPAADGTVKRTVTFTYPSAYGTVQAAAKADELDGFLRFAEGWLPVGDAVEVSPKREDGSYTVTRRVEGREAAFTFAEGSDLPVSVRLTDGRGVVEMAVKDRGE